MAAGGGSVTLGQLSGSSTRWGLAAAQCPHHGWGVLAQLDALFPSLQALAGLSAALGALFVPPWQQRLSILLETLKAGVLCFLAFVRSKKQHGVRISCYNPNTLWHS